MTRFALFLSTILLLGCGRGENFSDPPIQHKGIPAPGELTEVMEEVEIQQDLKLIRNGELRYEVENLDSGVTAIRQMINRFGGYVSNEASSQSRYSRSTSLTARVPSSKFDELLSAVEEGVEEFDTKIIDVQDVTASYYDLETRIRAKSKTEERYLEILKEAKNVEEILLVEKQLSAIRTEIEAMQGRFNLMQNKVELSTIEFDLYETLQIQKPRTNKFVKALQNGWSGLVAILVAVTTLWPLVLLVGFALYVLLKRRKKRMNKS